MRGLARDESGASIILAFGFVLLCATLSLLIVSSAHTSSGQVAADREAERAYLAAESGAAEGAAFFRKTFSAQVEIVSVTAKADGTLQYTLTDKAGAEATGIRHELATWATRELNAPTGDTFTVRISGKAGTDLESALEDTRVTYSMGQGRLTVTATAGGAEAQTRRLALEDAGGSLEWKDA